MSKKENIGKLFESRLSNGKKSPGKNLWSRISASLDMQKSRERRNLFYWAAGGILLLIGSFILFEDGFYSEDNSSEKIEKTFNNQRNPENEIQQNHPENLNKRNQSDSSKTSTEKLTRITTNSGVLNDSENVNNSSVKESPNRISVQKTKDSNQSRSKTKSVDETFTVTKKYYYYNSRDGKQVITTTQQEIDSLVSENNKIQDSLTKSPDSLKH